MKLPEIEGEITGTKRNLVQGRMFFHALTSPCLPRTLIWLQQKYLQARSCIIQPVMNHWVFYTGKNVNSTCKYALIAIKCNKDG